jgi:phage-related minor tail protein
MTGIRKNTNRMNATIQNAGYQFGDFFVQMQSGQNILVAFSQQGAQLAGLLPGLAGAVTGVGLVVGSMLVRALLDGSGAMKSLKESMEEAGEALSAFRARFTELSDGFRSELGPEIVRFTEVVMEKRLKESVDAVNESIEGMTGRFSNLTRELNKAAFAYDPKGLETSFRSVKEAVKSVSNVDPTNAEQLRTAIGTITKIISGELAPGLKLSSKLMETLEELGNEYTQTLKTITPEQEEITDELEAQKAHLEAILKLEQARDRLAQSLEQKFAASTRKLELMQGGMGAGLAGSQVSMEQQIAQVVAAERAVASQGMNPMQLQKYMGEYEAALLKRLQGYMTEQEAIAELQKIKKAQVEEQMTDEELLQQRINERLASLESEALMRRSLIGLSQEEANLVKTEYELEKAFGEDRRNFNAQQEAQFQSILELRRQNIAKIQEQKEAEEALKASQKIDEVLSTTEKQVTLDTKLLSLAKEEAELTQFIYDLETKLGATRSELSAEQQAQYDAIIAAKEAYILKTMEQKEAEEELKESNRTLKKQWEEYNKVQQKAADIAGVLAKETVGALKSVVNGTKTASEAFRDMALNIIQQIMDIVIWQPLIQSITSSLSGAIMGGMPVPGQRGGGTGFNIGSMIGGLFGGGASLGALYAKGGAFNAGNVIPFANGGIVGSPTMFGMSGGRTGLMGEAGPEAIMPLKRGPDGKLGVEGGGNVTVHQTFNFSANGDESVKKIIAQAAPRIAKMTEAQIINSRQRGGQMRRAFG